DDPVPFAHRKRDRRTLHLDDLAGHARKERSDLADDGLELSRRRLRSVTWCGLLCPGRGNAGDDRQQQDHRRDERNTARSLHPRHYITVPDTTRPRDPLLMDPLLTETGPGEIPGPVLANRRLA